MIKLIYEGIFESKQILSSKIEGLIFLYMIKRKKIILIEVEPINEALSNNPKNEQKNAKIPFNSK